MSSLYVVAIVLETDFGDRLSALASRMPVWIVDTPANRSSALRHWDPNADQPRQEGVTTFKFDQTQSPETWLIEILGAVDLHHGQYSHDPPYTAIEVFGAALTSTVREAFAEFGLTRFTQRPGGFVGTRTPMPPNGGEF